MDRDGDTVPDPEDACPDVAGPRSSDPKANGCPPPPDRDNDGIIDTADACPDQPGEPNQDPAKNGCPPPKDRDGDSILDEVDACPDAPGPANADPGKNGCPIARIEKGQIRITERVEFEFNKDALRPESNEVLTAVLEILKAHPEITKVLVEGHTDDKGADWYNKDLSKRRAASVVKWLTEKGVDAKRLDSKGLGKTRPIDDNKTEAGRQNNRRVEFHIQEINGKPAEAAKNGPLPAPPPPKPAAP
jgi:outer membrane protein OmpA-like peptidoglycan-associated protein